MRTPAINDATLDLIKRFEGCRLKAYRDAVGIWTIGYGHTSRAGPPEVRAGMRITEKEAEEILRRDVERFARDVARVLGDDIRRLNANQFGALVSFAYNVGIGNLKRSSVLKAVREGRDEDVPRMLLRWTRAGGRRLRGLVRRREAEGKLYMQPAQLPKKTPPPPSVEKKMVQARPRNRAGLFAALAAALAAAAGGIAAAWDWLVNFFH